MKQSKTRKILSGGLLIIGVVGILALSCSMRSVGGEIKRMFHCLI